MRADGGIWAGFQEGLQTRNETGTVTIEHETTTMKLCDDKHEHGATSTTTTGPSDRANATW